MASRSATVADPLGGLGTGRDPYDDDRYERTDELPVRERRHPGAVLLLGALSLLAVAGLAWVLYLVLGPGADDGPPMVAVPSAARLSGKRRPAAVAACCASRRVTPASTVMASSNGVTSRTARMRRIDSRTSP